jgi:phosphoribosyl 1,2-cyclic phosphodiesterase
MKLHIINSNSKGNAYILESSTGEALLIECGVNFNDIKKALKFNLSRVVGCIVTHEHQDHCKSVREVMAVGIDVYASPGTHEAMGTNKHHRAKGSFAENVTSLYVGNYKVRAFDVKHDAAEPIGYLIHHAECGTVLFLTDSYYCEYNFQGLNNIIIEANYCQTILDAKVEAGASPKFLRDRVIQSHMSLQTCKTTLQAYDLSQVQNIVLIHLSDGNSDEKRFKREVEEATGKAVFVAHHNQTIDFNKTAF